MIQQRQAGASNLGAQLMLTVILGVALGWVVLLITAARDGYGISILLATLGIIVSLFWIFKPWATRTRFDPFTPINLFVAFYLAIYGLGAINALYLYNFSLGDDASYFNWALLYVVLGLISFGWGYYSRLGYVLEKLLPPLPAFWSLRKLRRVGVFLTLLSVGSLFYFMQTTGGIIHYLTNMFQVMLMSMRGWNFYLLLFMPLANIALFMWYAYRVQHSLRGFVFWLYLAIVLLLNLAQSRGQTLAVLASLLIIRHYLKARIKASQLLIFGALAVAILLLAGIYREYTLFGEARLGNYRSLSGLSRYFIGHFDHFITFIEILKSIPDKFDYQFGRTMFLPFLLKPLPRSVFPWKPPGTATLFMQVLYPEQLAAGFSRAPSIVPELYLNFSVIGILVGLYILGTLARTLYTYLKRNAQNKAVVVFYAYTAMSLFSFLRNDFQTAVPAYLMFVLPLLLAMRCSYSPVGRSTTGFVGNK